jgi:hypothetical protein
MKWYMCIYTVGGRRVLAGEESISVHDKHGSNWLSVGWSVEIRIKFAFNLGVGHTASCATVIVTCLWFLLSFCLSEKGYLIAWKENYMFVASENRLLWANCNEKSTAKRTFTNYNKFMHFLYLVSFYSSASIIRMTKWRRMGWAG